MRKNKHKKLYTIVILFAIATFIIHLINRFIVASATFKDMLDILNRKYFKSRFGNIYYTKRGHGSPVLLIHDALPGSSGYEWNKVDKLIATEHTVYTIDLLGYGRSDKAGMTYTNYMYVQLIKSFINNVIHEKPDIIVSGYSSPFVIMAGAEAKNLFNKVILLNPPSPATFNQEITKKDQIFDYLLKLPIFGTLLYHMIVSRETSEKFFKEKLFYNYTETDKDILDAYHEAAHRGGYYAKYLASSLLSKKLNTNLENGIKSLTNEVIIIEGEYETSKDSIISTYTTLNPAISVESVPNSKHYPQIETPDKFMELMGKHLSK